MKRIISVLTALVMAVSLCACGGSGKAEDALAGTYKLYAMDYDESHIVLTDELFEGENYITLKSGGSAEMSLENETNNLKWKADGNNITVTAADGETTGTITDGVLALNVEGSNLYFLGEGASKDSLKAVSLDELLSGAVDEAINELAGSEADEPESDTETEAAEAVTEEETEAPETKAEAPRASAEPTEIQKMWNGWYYGCIDLDDCTGAWESVDGETFDAVLYVELGSDDKGKFAIFDPFGDLVSTEHSSKYVEGECHADSLYLYADSGEAFNDELYLNDWVFVHNTEIPEKIHVGSESTDENGDNIGYDFQFKPWGDRWDGDNYTKFIPRFDAYIQAVDAGVASPFDDSFTGFGIAEYMSASNASASNGSASGTQASNASASSESTNTQEESSAADAGTTGGNSTEADRSGTKLDINDRGIVCVYYPDDQFIYDDTYGKLKNEDTGLGILIDPMLGEANFEELKASYEEHNSSEEDYSLVETTVNGYKALILKYSDWLGSTMRVDLDFGGNHDGWYGISFAVSGDSLADCDTDLVWNVIQSMELLK